MAELGEARDLAHLVRRVESGDFVRLGQSRVVEDGFDQVVDGATAAHDRLPDVDKLGGAGAEDVDAEQRPVLKRYQELEHAVGVTDDLPAGKFPVPGDPHFERHVSLCELIFRPPDEADLGNAVYADRLELPWRVQRLSAGMVPRKTALFHGCGREGGKADDVAHRIYMQNGGAEELIHPYPAAAVRCKTGGAEVQFVAHPLAAGRVHDGVGRDLLPAAECRDGAFGPGVDGRHGLAEPEGHRKIPEMVFQRLDNLFVTELKHPVALLNDCDLGAEGGEH